MERTSRLLMVACACGMSAFTLAPPAAQAQRVSCTYSRGVEKRCGPYACVVDDYRPDFEDEPDPPPGTPGSCGKCRNASDCGGAACKHDGTCAGWPAPTAPEPLRPRIFMLTTDLALDVMDADSPLVSAGFLGQFALSKTRPVALADGGWLTKDLPRWYVSTEAALAFAGPGQNFFFRLGPTYYIHTGPIYITALTAGGVYQRQGASIWDFGDDAENFQRLGPFAAVDFLYNLRVSLAYAWTAGGALGDVTDDAFFLSIAYQRDLVSDLVPDRFQKHIPGKYR